jgi:hypothetical protein
MVRYSPDGGGTVFTRNVGTQPDYYTVQQPGRLSSLYRRETLIFYRL